jgi:putative oxidoreductase
MQTRLHALTVRFARGPALGDAAALAARVLVAYLFVMEGWGKIGSYADVQAYMTQFGVEPRLLPLVIALEFGGGLALALGAATRPAALALGVFSLLTALIFHEGADYSEALEFRKDFAIAGGLFALAALGAGAWSLDALVARRLMPALARGRADAVPR